MKKYVFFANTLTGVSGGTIYVRNKKKYLEANGWEVVVFDNALNSGLILPDLEKYKDNRIYELSFPPSWYSKRERNKILRKITDIIQPTKDGVLESDQLSLAEWGELVAERLNWQHLIYDINEKDVINDFKHFEFLYDKLKKNQLFFISEKACKNAFSKYIEINDASLHYWKAGVDNEISDIHIAELDNLEKATYNIGYFGRYKSFMPYVIRQLRKFSEKHKTSTVNFIVLGFTEFTIDDKTVLNVPNLRVTCIDAQPIIPKVFFDKTDVIVATAGCASIAYRYGAIVISMNVENDRPIGIMGYTTNSSTFDEKGYNDYDLASIIDEVYTTRNFIYKRINDTGISRPNILKNYDVQLQYAVSKTYYNTINIYNAHTISRFFQMLIVRTGGSLLLFNIKR